MVTLVPEESVGRGLRGYKGEVRARMVALVPEKVLVQTHVTPWPKAQALPPEAQPAEIAAVPWLSSWVLYL